MSLDTAENRPVHFPADPAKFAFDSEVSQVFPDMAVRSIPNFLEAHRAHARMLRGWMKEGVKVLDIGSSRGAFIQALMNEYPVSGTLGEFKITAIDISPDMCEFLRRDFPGVDVLEMDISSNPFFALQDESFDVICVNYVLQFVPEAYQSAVFLKILRLLKPGGVLILGHKSRHGGRSGDAAHEEYIRFRLENGYTREEIEAKTAALKGSMFPMNHATVMQTLKHQFDEVTETFRFMMFSTIFAVKWRN